MTARVSLESQSRGADANGEAIGPPAGVILQHVVDGRVTSGSEGAQVSVHADSSKNWAWSTLILGALAR